MIMVPPAPRAICGDIELRMITPRSAGQLYALARDPNVSAYLQWSPHQTTEDSLTYIHDTRKLWQHGSAWLVGIFDRAREQLIGCTGLSSIDLPNHRAEAGSWIGVARQGQGHNVAAKAALATVAFELLGIERIEFLVMIDNIQSLAAMRKLPSIREEGTLAKRLWREGKGFDAVLFALVKDDFDPEMWPSVKLITSSTTR